MLIYCCDHYGSMLWDLFSESTAKYYRCWNTCVKLAWRCPRNTHTYFVGNMLAQDFSSIKTRILSRYVKFVDSLLNSASPEVVAVANNAVNDEGSTTGANLFNLQQLTVLNSKEMSPARVMEALKKQDKTMPAAEQWRIPLLEKLMIARSQKEQTLQETNDINLLINSLCSS